MTRRPFHVGCEFTGLGICYCHDGTPEHLRDPQAAEEYCQRAEEIAELWSTVSNVQDSPEETQVLLPVLFKRRTRSKHTVNIEGLKSAQDEADNARASAERQVLKAARKANALGISHTLLRDLGINEDQVGIPVATETIEQKLQSLQAQQDQTRQWMRQLDEEKDGMGMDAEREAHAVGDAMESTLVRLKETKGRLPPDRVGEVVAVEEAAQVIVTRARKTRRKQRRLLKSEDISEGLAGSWLSVFWPDDNQWWNGFVQSVNTSQATATLLYETEEAEEVNLKQLIEKGEVAWLEIPTASDPVPKRRKKHHSTNP